MLTPIIVQESDYPELFAAWIARAERELPDVHANRRREWASGRVALTVAFRSVGIELSPDTTQFQGYQSVVGFSEWKFSLSNTKGYGAAVVVDTSTVHGLGLDVELRSRNVVEGVATRMKHADDSPQYSGIERWCAKEAVYKALPSEIQSKIWLNNIAVKESSFSVGAMAGELRWSSHPDLVVMVATL